MQWWHRQVRDLQGSFDGIRFMHVYPDYNFLQPDKHSKKEIALNLQCARGKLEIFKQNIIPNKIEFPKRQLCPISVNLLTDNLES